MTNIYLSGTIKSKFVKKGILMKNMYECSAKLDAVHSDIRGPLYIEAMKLEQEGKKILKINSGNLAIFGLSAPESVKKLIIENIDSAVPYCDFRGMPAARAAIRKYHESQGIKDISDDNIYIGNGVSEIADICVSIVLNENDELLVPDPCYSLWSNCARKVGGVPVYYTCDEEADWFPDIDDIRKKITPRTKAIVLINPNNPTGAVYSKQCLEEIIQIARENNLIIFSDEIYDKLLYDGAEHISTASLAPDLFVVTINGLSKSHRICGFRCGWMVISGPGKYSEKFRQNVDKLMAIRLCAGALPQLIIPAAIDDFQSVKNAVSVGGELYERRKSTLDAIAKCEALECVKNMGALYVFPRIKKGFKVTDDREFARQLLIQKQILLVPGSGFDHKTPDHFRMVMLPEPKLLEDAVMQIDDLLCKHYK